MIRVEFMAFCDLWADLRIRLATLRKSIRKSCSVALTCVDLRVRAFGRGNCFPSSQSARATKRCYIFTAR